MAEHDITIHRVIPKGKRNAHYVAVCSCERWRSEPFRKWKDADKKGLAHQVRGDEHNRALAALSHGSKMKVTTELQWYRDQADDPLTPEKDREIWLRLAEELADRLKGDGTEQTELPL